MVAINPVGAADGDADGVHRDRVVAGQIRQQLEGMGIREKVFRMDLEPSDRGASGHHLRKVRKPKTDTGLFKRQWSGVTGDGHVLLLVTSVEGCHRRCGRSSPPARRSTLSDRY